MVLHDSPARDAATPDMIELLARLVREIEQIATGCTALQWSISSLLDKVDHPDLAEEMHMLQDIDRMQQTLVDIAAVLEVVSGPAGMIRLPQTAIDAVIKLESLRERLWESSTAAERREQIGHHATGITWL